MLMLKTFVALALAGVAAAVPVKQMVSARLQKFQTQLKQSFAVGRGPKKCWQAGRRACIHSFTNSLLIVPWFCSVG